MRERGSKGSRKGNRLQGKFEKQAFIKWGLQVLHRLSTAQMVGGLKGFMEEGRRDIHRNGLASWGRGGGVGNRAWLTL